MRLISVFTYCLLFIFLAPTNMKAQLNNPKNLAFDWNTDLSSKTVELSEITMVLPRGSFPTIDYPAFIGKQGASEQYFEYEPVLSVEIEGRAKAYPLNVLTMHEISNDSLSNVPILPSYCPLCNSGVVYDRRLHFQGETRTLEFEVSGMLRNSDMVMADRQSESLWQQLMGEGIVGKYAGAKLNIIPSIVLSVKDFFEAYPDGKILSPETDSEARESYGSNPYVHYDSEGAIPYERYFKSSKIDSRLPAMERIVEVRGSDGYKIYPFSSIRDAGIINDHYDGMHLVVFYESETVSILDERDISDSRAIGSAAVFSPVVMDRKLTFVRRKGRITDEETGSVWNMAGICTEGPMKGNQLQVLPHGNHFAFAWLSFYPDSEIYNEN